MTSPVGKPEVNTQVSLAYIHFGIGRSRILYDTDAEIKKRALSNGNYFRYLDGLGE